MSNIRRINCALSSNGSVKLGEKLKWWNSSYQPIVSQDKDAFIRRYSRTERSLAAKGQDIQRHKDVQADIAQEEYAWLFLRPVEGSGAGCRQDKL